MKFFRISTPFSEKQVSVFCSFWQFPLPLSKTQGVDFAKTSFLHSHFLKTREWILQKQAFCTPPSQKSGSGFFKNKFFHSCSPKTREWSSPKQASSHLRVRCMPSVPYCVPRGLVWQCPCAGPLGLATPSGSEDRTNIEANDLARHPQFLSPDTLT